ncbi:vWA domain-containing protein [Vulcanisaeta souniana]|uniref:vWA domain-containing protein n=1 Tax=Vulcanisaeta souniana TaxID=164452 RepID=UPI0006D034CD|nr:vWA domain-containing protein [Vulcanisaeta souniana]
MVIDRSGSMGEPMPGSRIEKVSVATAVAISLVLAYEDVHVYAFDTRIHDLGSGSIVIEPLLRLAPPDGGTSIANALTLANSLSEESIIITDAIDPDVDPELARRVMERSRIIILEPAEYFDWVKPYIQGGRAVIAKTPSDVIEFLASPPGTAGGA